MANRHDATSDRPLLLVACKAGAGGRAALAAAVGDEAELAYLEDAAPEDRAALLSRAGAILARNTANDFAPEELTALAGVKLLQFFSAGVDFIPLRDLPPDLPVAGNGGAFAVPMAEHALAMALAAKKRLLVEHEKLKTGEFNQFVRNGTLSGGVCGIFGYGGIGQAVARLMRAMGMTIHAINRSGRAEEPADWLGTPDRLDELLQAADVFVIATPLSQSTEGVIDAAALARMKPDAVLVNLARGEIVDEAALFAHLRSHPEFFACLDAWWVEPVRHGRFEMGHPFLDLHNVVGSPHNSASVGGSAPNAWRAAAENCLRALRGEAPRHLVQPEERML